MKKTAVFLLVSIMVLMICMSTAGAAGRLSVVTENYYTVKRYNSLYGYAYAKIENVGNKPIMINTGLLEIFDTDGDAITSTDNKSKYAQYLQPGEYTYFQMSVTMPEGTTSEMVDDYMLTVSGKSDMDYNTIRLDCVNEYEEGVKSGYYTYNYMYATVTNNTDEPLYGIAVVFALLDSDENILYITSDSLDSNEALLPGSSIMFRCAVADYFVTYMEENNIVPASLDTIAYYYEKK